MCKQLDPSTVTLLDKDGNPANSVDALDEDGNKVGTYELKDGVITFTPEKDFVGTAQPVTVQIKDKNGTPVETTYTPTVTPGAPTGEPDTSEGKQGEEQTGTPEFKPGSEEAPMTLYTLVDKDGNEVTELTVDGEGKYTIDPETGDKNHMALNLSLIFGSFGTIIAMIFKRKKKNEEEE